MNRKRLELLAKRLDLEQSRNDPMENFDMGLWASGLNAISEDGVFQAECGTTACAAGLATTVPELRAAGLSMNDFMFCWDPYKHIGRFFGLNVADSIYLFSAHSYDGYETEPIHVADRIRELLAMETS